MTDLHRENFKQRAKTAADTAEKEKREKQRKRDETNVTLDHVRERTEERMAGLGVVVRSASAHGNDTGSDVTDTCDIDSFLCGSVGGRIGNRVRDAHSIASILRRNKSHSDVRLLALEPRNQIRSKERTVDQQGARPFDPEESPPSPSSPSVSRHSFSSSSSSSSSSSPPLCQPTSHPNIVHCYRALHSPRAVFLVLEYCDGGDIFEAMLKQPHSFFPGMEKKNEGQGLSHP